MPSSCAGFKFLAISSKNIQYCGSILKFSITFSYGCLEGLGTKSESTISNTPSKSFSIPILFVTFAACAFDPLVNIIFLPLSFAISFSKGSFFCKNLNQRHEQTLRTHWHLFYDF